MERKQKQLQLLQSQSLRINLHHRHVRRWRKTGTATERRLDGGCAYLPLNQCVVCLCRWANDEQTGTQIKWRCAHCSLPRRAVVRPYRLHGNNGKIQYVTSWKEIALHQKTYHDEGLFLSSIDHTHEIITFLITPTFCYSLPVSSRGSRSSVFQTVLIQVDGLRSSGLLARSSLLPYTVE